MSKAILRAVLLAAALAGGGVASAQPGAAPAVSPAPSPAAPDFSKVTITTTDLGHATYMLQGQGGNITVAVGGDGVIMVDSQFAPLHDKIKAAVAALTPLPILYVVNTHFHGDHSGGDAAFAADGAVVVAQANVKSRLAAGTVSGLTGAVNPPLTGAALPSRIFQGALTVTVKDRAARLRHYPNAHTDGDTYVYFPDADVLSTGDIVISGRYPNIDVAYGGTIKGMIGATEALLALAGPNTKIVPGHGPLMTKADMQAYHDLLVSARDRVAVLVAAGKSEDEAIAAKPLADLDAKVGAAPQASANFTRVIYRSLKPA